MTAMYSTLAIHGHRSLCSGPIALKLGVGGDSL